MNASEKIQDDLKQAMKNKDELKVAALRLIKNQVKNHEIELKRPLKEQEFFAVLSRMTKQVHESLEHYQKAGRDDLVQKDQNELKVIESYLPKQLSGEELADLIKQAIRKTGATLPAQMGLVMKELKEKTAGRVDGKILADRVKAILSDQNS